MVNDNTGTTRIYSYPKRPDAPKDRIIDASKKISSIEKEIDKKTKRETCLICGKQCHSFCQSHSIPDFVLQNIAESGEVSAPRQIDSLRPNKGTGIRSAGVFFNICDDCDNQIFQVYEKEEAFESLPADRMLTAIALKNCLKVIYNRLIDVEEEKLYMLLGAGPEIVSSGELSPAEYAVKEFQRELDYALQAQLSVDGENYHLCYYKKLDYVVPLAVQYPIAMLTDLDGNVIHDFYTGSDTYNLEYLHIAIFPLKQASIILIFSKYGEKRHEQFFSQLQKLGDLDQLSVINFLVFTGMDNVFLNKSTYASMVQNPFFMAACRLTYSVYSEDPNPSNALDIALRMHSFKNRYIVPNLLSPIHAIKKMDSAPK